LSCEAFALCHYQNPQAEACATYVACGINAGVR
jgi:hypothetical protein